MMKHLLQNKFRSSFVWTFLLSGVAAGHALAAEPKKPATKSPPPKTTEPRKPNAVTPDAGKPEATKGVVALFAEAQKLYNAGKFNEALVAYDRIIRKYPSHEPSIIQYAKTLYRLDRIAESYNLFARINPQYLDPETSYEYGYSSYVNQRWDAALYGFKRVPQDHALYDLANYYGALSAIKLKRYAEAEEMLDKAVVLPDKLSKSRLLYQRHVQSLKNLQERAELAQLAEAERARLNMKKSGPIGPTAATPGAPKVDPKAYKHKGFLVIDRFAILKVSQEHQTIDKHGFSQTTYDNDVGSFEFNHGPLVQLPMKKMGNNSSATGMQINLSIEDRNSKGKQERIVAYEDSADTPRALNNDLPALHTTTGKIGVSPWIEFAMPNSWWTGVKGSLSFQYPDFKRGQRTSKRSIKPHVGKQFSFGPHNGFVLGSFLYEQLTDSETEPLIDTAATELNTTLTFSSATSVETILTAKQFNYQLPTISGPDATYSGSLAVYQTFPLGIILSGKGVAASQQNNIVKGLPSYDAASADGTTISGTAQIEATPIAWLTLYAKYDLSKTTWNVHQAEREEVYKKNVPDYVDQTTLSASLNFLF